MIPIPQLLLPFSTTLAQVWFAGLWQGLVLVAVVGIAMRLLPRLGAGRRSAVWLAVLALLVFLPFSLHFDVLRHGILSHKRGQETAYLLDARWSVLLTAVWAALSAVRAARLTADLVLVRGLCRRALPFAPKTVQPEFAGRVFLSSEVTRPCVAGMLRPRILLPVDLPGQLTAAELRQVLLHEQEHIRRRDPWVNFAQKALLVLFPLSPALLMIDRRLCLERELACDDQVMRITGARKGYAICLARIAEHRLLTQSVLGSGAALVLGAWHRRPELVRRVERILRGAPVEMTGVRAGFAAAAVLLGMGVTLIALLQVPDLVGFSSPASTMSHAALPREADTHQGIMEGYGTDYPVRATLRQKSAPVQRAAATTRRRARQFGFTPPRVVRTRVFRTRKAHRIEVSWRVEQRVQLVPVLYLVPVEQGWILVQI